MSETLPTTLPITALEVAEYLIYLDWKTSRLPKNQRVYWCPITNLKLHKLLYYCQANTLLAIKKPLFHCLIHAWQYGPAVPTVYNYYHSYESTFFYEINHLHKKYAFLEDNDTNFNNISDTFKKYISEVYKMFFAQTAKKMVNDLQKQYPWVVAYHESPDTEIKIIDIYEYFSK